MPTVTGTIRSPANTTSSIVFQVIRRSAAPQNVAFVSGSFSTDLSGNFSLSLEPGQYDLILPGSDVISFQVPIGLSSYNITTILR